MDRRFESQPTHIPRLHRRWADGLTITPMIVVVPVFGDISFLFDQMDLAASARILPPILSYGHIPYFGNSTVALDQTSLSRTDRNHRI
jgi:hypothetical protein